MKKVMILAATALVCLSFASCEKGTCTCKINDNGTRSTIKYDESALQEKGVSTCKDLGTALEKAYQIAAILTDAKYSASCH